MLRLIPNRGSPPAILLRESFRENGKTKNRTLGDLSGWPAERIELLRAVLRGDRLLPATRRCRSSAHCRMATCSPRWAPRGASNWTRCCRAVRRSGGAIWRWP
jgi:hypothetical protein